MGKVIDISNVFAEEAENNNSEFINKIREITKRVIGMEPTEQILNYIISYIGLFQEGLEAMECKGDSNLGDALAEILYDFFDGDNIKNNEAFYSLIRGFLIGWTHCIRSFDF